MVAANDQIHSGFFGSIRDLVGKRSKINSFTIENDTLNVFLQRMTVPNDQIHSGFVWHSGQLGHSGQIVHLGRFLPFGTNRSFGTNCSFGTFLSFGTNWHVTSALRPSLPPAALKHTMAPEQDHVETSKHGCANAP